jgi:hypothetical protein
MGQIQKTTIASLLALMVVGGAGCGQPDDIEKVTGAVARTTSCSSMAVTDICVCTDPNFTGQCVGLDILTRYFMNLSTFPTLQGFNDKITSIKVGATARGKICADPGGNGNCGYLQAGQSIPNLSLGLGCFGGTLDFGWGAKCMNDNITSVRVDKDSFDCMNPGTSQATIFEDPNFNGGMHKPSGNSRDCVVLNQGSTVEYPNPFLNPIDGGEIGGGFGLNTDVISSVKLGPTTLVHLFADPNFTGTEFDVNADAPTLPSTIDNKTSSIIVF